MRSTWLMLVLVGRVVAGCARGPAPKAPSPAPLRTPFPTSLASGEGAVVGGIAFCGGVVPTVHPRFVAGTVVVLRGSMSSVAVSPGVTRAGLPPVEVAVEEVGVNQKFGFVLASGSYVLSAGAPWAPVDVGVRSGETSWRTIPGGCI